MAVRIGHSSEYEDHEYSRRYTALSVQMKKAEDERNLKGQECHWSYVVWLVEAGGWEALLWAGYWLNTDICDLCVRV